MQTKSRIVTMTLVLAAMAASFAAGVNSVDRHGSHHHEAASGGGSVVLEREGFDYFPSQYANQATDIEELPATF
jgi:hypothetical protein